jgi:hypothetical protein
MMTGMISINRTGGQPVPLQRPTDAIGSVLRAAFAQRGLPDDMAVLLQRLDRRSHRC